MLSTWVFLAVVAGSFLHTEASVVYKCDNSVIEKVKKLGGSTGILEKLVTYGTMSISKNTKDYFQSDVKCSSIKFYKEAGNTATKEFVHIALKDTGKNRDKTLNVVEEAGVFSDKEKTLMRYPVYSKNNVFACYTCSTSAQATVGPPAGFVAVKEHGYNQNDVTAALAALNSVGVSATESYPDVCP